MMVKSQVEPSDALKEQQDRIVCALAEVKADNPFLSKILLDRPWIEGPLETVTVALTYNIIGMATMSLDEMKGKSDKALKILVLERITKSNRDILRLVEGTVEQLDCLKQELEDGN